MDKRDKRNIDQGMLQVAFFKHPVKLKFPPFPAPPLEIPNNCSDSTLILLPQ